jgi:pimeloyl-ACP methyl ester carboxylesterase
MFHLIVDRLAEALPGVRHVAIPKASRSMSSGNPQAYNQAVMEFLRE